MESSWSEWYAERSSASPSSSESDEHCLSEAHRLYMINYIAQAVLIEERLITAFIR